MQFSVSFAEMKMKINGVDLYFISQSMFAARGGGVGGGGGGVGGGGG